MLRHVVEDFLGNAVQSCLDLQRCLELLADGGLELEDECPHLGETRLAQRAAWGEDSDWYRNLRSAPAMEARTGGERYAPAQRFLNPVEVGAALANFERRHPYFSRLVSRMLGGPLDDTPTSRRILASRVRMVAFSQTRASLGRG
jgi:hypothetical protein